MRLRDQGFALVRAAQKHDRRLRRDALRIGAVADISEGGVGEREDHSAVRAAVAVEHVGA